MCRRNAEAGRPQARDGLQVQVRGSRLEHRRQGNPAAAMDSLAAATQADTATRTAVSPAEAVAQTRVVAATRMAADGRMVPAIRALRDTAERARRHEIERALRRLARGDDPRLVIEYLSHGLTNKLLHAPTHALSHAAEGEREALATLLARLYQIPRAQ